MGDYHRSELSPSARCQGQELLHLQFWSPSKSGACCCCRMPSGPREHAWLWERLYVSLMPAFSCNVDQPSTKHIHPLFSQLNSNPHTCDKSMCLTFTTCWKWSALRRRPQLIQYQFAHWRWFSVIKLTFQIEVFFSLLTGNCNSTDVIFRSFH